MLIYVSKMMIYIHIADIVPNYTLVIFWNNVHVCVHACFLPSVYLWPRNVMSVYTKLLHLHSVFEFRTPYLRNNSLHTNTKKRLSWTLVVFIDIVKEYYSVAGYGPFITHFRISLISKKNFRMMFLIFINIVYA